MFGIAALVELLDPALLDEQRRIRRVVGHHDDVAPDRLAAGERRLDLPEEAGVVVDVLDVLDLDAVLLRELVELRVALRLLLDVDVERPVREDERLATQLVRVGARRPRRGRQGPGNASAAPPTAARRSRSERVRLSVMSILLLCALDRRRMWPPGRTRARPARPARSPPLRAPCSARTTVTRPPWSRRCTAWRRRRRPSRWTRPRRRSCPAAEPDLLGTHADRDLARPAGRAPPRDTITSPPPSSRTAVDPATVPRRDSRRRGNRRRRRSAAARRARSACPAARSGRRCMTAIVSAIVIASSWSCVTWTNVMPTSCWIRFSSSCICLRSFRSRAPSARRGGEPAGGSRAPGRARRAAAGHPRAGAASALEAARSDALEHSATRRVTAALDAARRSPNATFSTIVRCGKSAYHWKTVLTSRLYGGSP